MRPKETRHSAYGGNGREAASRNDTTKLPSTLEGELLQFAPDSRFSFRPKKQVINRKLNRKNERLAKKQKTTTHDLMRKESSKLRTAPAIPSKDPKSRAMMASALARTNAILKRREQEKKISEAALKVKSDKEREGRQLHKLAETNPAFFKSLQDQNLVSKRIIIKNNGLSAGMDLDGDESNIQTYSKLLKLKDGTINQSFKRDGLDFLLDGISTNTPSSLHKTRDHPDDDSEDEFGFADENQSDVEMNTEQEEHHSNEEEILSDINSFLDGSQSDESDSYSESSETSETSEMEGHSISDDVDNHHQLDTPTGEESEIEPPSDTKAIGASASQHRVSAGTSSTAVSGKYIPPFLRKVDTTRTEKYLRLKRQLQGLLNRLTDTTLESIVMSIEEVFRSNSRHDVTEIITDIMLSYVGDQSNILDSFITTYAGLIAALYNAVGIEFGAHFIQALTEQFDTSRNRSLDAKQSEKDDTDKRCTNFSMLLAMLYNFEVVSCVLLYDIIRMSIESLNELDVEVLLRILRLGGHQLRSDDPASLKDIVLLIKEAIGKRDQKTLSARLKFMVDTIMDIKNNKRKHADQKVANQSQQDRIKKAVANISKRRSLHGPEPLRVSLDDIRSIQTKGKWWLVGTAWAGHDADGDSAAKRETARGLSESSSQKAPQELLEIARRHKMHTDVRRSIFVVLMSSEDCVDAFERLLRLNLKDKQERDIVRVIIHCCNLEGVYNPYYSLVSEQLCKNAHSFKITFQYAVWDVLKALGDEEEGEYTGEKGLIRVSNLAKMLAHLIGNESLPLSILKAANFTTPTKLQILFFRLLLMDIFIKSPVVASSNPDSKFQKPFVRIKSQPDLTDLCEGLLLILQAHVLPPLRSRKFGVLGIKEKDVTIVKRRVKLVKDLLS
ncbi:hypothetical protein BASA84_001436 [Batrachochytrium salamandrivorans]|nr:hypothetical protein BASA84_001436 [Batrachochytrium salamandrivorans]